LAVSPRRWKKNYRRIVRKLTALGSVAQTGKSARLKNERLTVRFGPDPLRNIVNDWRLTLRLQKVTAITRGIKALGLGACEIGVQT
jgi:hypothetical protein